MATTPVSYQVTDWCDQFKASRTAGWKQLGYAVARPLFNFEARRQLTGTALKSHTPSAVFRERGFPVETRRQWALAGLDLRNAVVLVQGTGSGWDVLTWACLRPKRIIATDLFAFDAWTDISTYCARTWNVACEFRRAPLEDHSFLGDGSIDVCVSDAVFEHCRDLDGVLAESHRVLKAGGRLYAGYGPLWFCGGGDHYSGRGGLHNLYNHLILSPTEYKTYIEKCRQETERFQDGYRYVDLNLFSRLTTDGYLRAFRKAGFKVDDLILEVSSEALRFRRMFPSFLGQVLDATAGRCSIDDLLLKGNLVKLTRA